MGILYIKKPVIENWLRVTKKNYLWIAKHYKNVSPSYISQCMNNTTNIAGNLVGFLIHETKLDYNDLFYYDPNIVDRDFFGKEVFVNGNLFKTKDYKQLVRDTIEEKIVLDTIA